MILLVAQHLLTSVPLPTSDPASKPTLINNKDSSLESTGKKDPQVEHVLLASPCTVRKRPAPEDTSKSNSDCQIAGASKPSIPSIKRKRQNIDDKENNDPNTDCQITGSAKRYVSSPSVDDKTWTARTWT